jgi:uncharacterized protein (TIGR03089 family)
MSEDWVGRLLDGLLREPGRPRVTWYGGEGERVELSGAVLTNWVTKTANLLVEEFDAGPGLRIRLDLPMHWRTVCWALAVWRVGACVVLDDLPADLVVTDRPDRAPAGAELVAVALPALARRFDGPLPNGAIDAAAVLAGYPDVLGPSQSVDPGLAALAGVETQLSHRELATPEPGPGPRRVLTTAAPRVDGPALLDLLRTLRADGSCVLVGPDHPAAGPGAASRAERARLAGVERAELDPQA